MTIKWCWETRCETCARCLSVSVEQLKCRAVERVWSAESRLELGKLLKGDPAVLVLVQHAAQQRQGGAVRSFGGQQTQKLAKQGLPTSFMCFVGTLNNFTLYFWAQKLNVRVCCLDDKVLMREVALAFKLQTGELVKHPSQLLLAGGRHPRHANLLLRLQHVSRLEKKNEQLI